MSVTLKWYNKTKQNKTKYDKNCKFDLKFKTKAMLNTCAHKQQFALFLLHWSQRIFSQNWPDLREKYFMSNYIWKWAVLPTKNTKILGLRFGNQFSSDSDCWSVLHWSHYFWQVLKFLQRQTHLDQKMSVKNGLVIFFAQFIGFK